MVTISTTPRIYAVQGSQCYHINYAYSRSTSPFFFILQIFVMRKGKF